MLTKRHADRLAPRLDVESPDLLAERNEMRARLFGALDSLPPDEREAVALCHVSGMTFAEASHVAGVRLGTLKTRVRRGMERLRQRLRPEAASLEALLGVAIIPQPVGGWEAARARWESAATATGTDIGLSHAAWMTKAGLPAAATLAIVCAVWFLRQPEAASSGKADRQLAPDAVASKPSASPDFRKPLLVTRAIVAPVMEGSAASQEITFSEMKAEPSGAIPVGSVRQCRAYYPTGEVAQTWSERVTATGVVKEGDCAQWHTNGKKMAEGRLADNRRQGRWIFYWEDGALSAEGEYVSGSREGFWQNWYCEGKPMSAGIFVNNRQHGEWRSWHENGALQQEWELRDGDRQGQSRHYNDRGSLTRTTNWANGVKHGIETVYTPDGRETLRRYNNGKLIQETTEADDSGG